METGVAPSARRALATPPHPMPLGAMTITVEASKLLDTVAWLCDRVQEQDIRISALEGNPVAVDAIATGSVQGTRELRLPGVQDRDLGPLLIEEDNEPASPKQGILSPKSPTSPTSRGTLSHPGSRPLSVQAKVDLTGALKAVQLGLESLQLAQKRMEQHIQTQEAEQEERDAQQDLALKEELGRLTGKLEQCVSGLDLKDGGAVHGSAGLDIPLDAEAQAHCIAELQANLQDMMNFTHEAIEHLGSQREEDMRRVAELGGQVTFIGNHCAIPQESLRQAAEESCEKHTEQVKSSKDEDVLTALRAKSPAMLTASTEPGSPTLAGAAFGLDARLQGSPSSRGSPASPVAKFQGIQDKLAAHDAQLGALQSAVGDLQAALANLAAATGHHDVAHEVNTAPIEAARPSSQDFSVEAARAPFDKKGFKQLEGRVVRLEKAMSSRAVSPAGGQGRDSLSAAGPSGVDMVTLVNEVQRIKRDIAALQGDLHSDISESSKEGAHHHASREDNGKKVETKKTAKDGDKEDRGGKQAKPGGEAAAKSAARRAEAAAKAAEGSAQTAAKIRQEVEEILAAMEVPPGVDVEALLEGRHDEAAECGEEPMVRGQSPLVRSTIGAKKEDESLNDFLSRQMQVEDRLKQLEAQLEDAKDEAKRGREDGDAGGVGDGSTGGADGTSPSSPTSPTGSASQPLLNGLAIIIKDVRLCLQRCELMYQLPEIRLFVKRFMRSLQVSAVLNQRWLGPGAGKVVNGFSAVAAASAACAAEDSGERPVGSRGSSARQMIGGQDSMAASAPELRADPGGSFYGHNGSQRRQKARTVDASKKKPFRTVVDWCRPHTPLAVDPVARIDGINYKPPERGSGVRLPQI